MEGRVAKTQRSSREPKDLARSLSSLKGTKRSFLQKGKVLAYLGLHQNLVDPKDLTSSAHPGVASKDKRRAWLMRFGDSRSNSFINLFSIRIFLNHIHNGVK
jgi:hypothetical protein